MTAMCSVTKCDQMCDKHIDIGSQNTLERVQNRPIPLCHKGFQPSRLSVTRSICDRAVTHER